MRPTQEEQIRTQQHLKSLERSISELKVTNFELSARMRLLTEQAELHESHLDLISSHEVSGD